MMTDMRFAERQTLLIDLDDTLCENNVYFERAIADFITFLDHQEHTREQVRLVLNEVERESIMKHGYGLHSFAHSLVDCFERLSINPVTPELHQTIWGFAHKIAEHPMEIIPGVPETLEYLAKRHQLIVMTKGNLTEQAGKIERSDLKHFFTAVEVVAEKNVPTYREIVEKYALVKAETWMVGNSPKSDINPALGVGIHAIFIPHDQTWILEHEELATPATNSQRLLTLERFEQLQKLF
ncbi:MAG TPA: HAD family hydrolase [Terriglobales bacterium]|nr:HAD family hydrolase [Terriglobales bacterium]